MTEPRTQTPRSRKHLRTPRSQRGSVLLLTYLLAASTLLVLAQVAQVRTLTETVGATRFVNSQLARQTAESGLQDAMARLLQTSTYAGTGTDSWVSLPTLGQQFQTQVTDLGSNAYRVTSWGQVGSTTRQLTAYVARANTAPFQFAAFGTLLGSNAVWLNLGNPKTGSYDSSVTTSPTSLGPKGDVGTNSTSTSAIYVNSGTVNGNAWIGPGGDFNTAIFGSALSITGSRGPMASLRSYPVLPIPYPFQPTSTPSPNAQNTSDPSDWKNEFVGATAPPSLWQSEILNHPWFPPDSNTNSTSTSACIYASDIPTSTCSLWIRGSTVIDQPLTFSCAGGAYLRVEGTLLVTSAGSLSNVNRIKVMNNLSVSNCGPYFMIPSNIIGPVSFTTDNATTHPRMLVIRKGGLNGAVGPVDYFYASDGTWSTTTTSTSTVDDVSADVTLSGVGSLGYVKTRFAGGLSSGNRFYANRLLPTVAKTLAFTNGTQSLLYLQTGSSPTKIQGLHSLYVAGNFTLPNNDRTISFDGAGSTMYTEGSLTTNFSTTVNSIERIFAYTYFTAGAPVGSSIGNGTVNFTGTQPTLFARLGIAIGELGYVSGVNRVIGAVVATSLDPVSVGNTLQFSGSDARLYSGHRIFVGNSTGSASVRHSSYRPADLLIVSTSALPANDSILLQDGQVWGAIYAPGIPVILRPQGFYSYLYGAVIGNTVTLDGTTGNYPVRIYYDTLLANQPFNFSPPSIKLLAAREN